MKERDMVHPTDRELSRRSFLKGTVLAGAGVGAMGALAACGPSARKTISPARALLPIL